MKNCLQQYFECLCYQCNIWRTVYSNILNVYVANGAISASLSLFKWKHEFLTEWWLQILKLCPLKSEIKETKMAMQSEPWFDSVPCHTPVEHKRRSLFWLNMINIIMSKQFTCYKRIDIRLFRQTMRFDVLFKAPSRMWGHRFSSCLIRY